MVQEISHLLSSSLQNMSSSAAKWPATWLMCMLLVYAQESFHYLRYKTSENTIYSYADDLAPRHLSAALPLDYDTVAGGDKFGNFFVVRLPSEVSALVRMFYSSAVHVHCAPDYHYANLLAVLHTYRHTRT